jgi:hypothetical protein
MTSSSPYTPEQVERAKAVWAKRVSDGKFLMFLFVVPWPLLIIPATRESLFGPELKPISMAVFFAYETAIILLLRRKTICPGCRAQLGNARIRLKFCPRCAIPLE